MIAMRSVVVLLALLASAFARGPATIQSKNYPKFSFGSDNNFGFKISTTAYRLNIVRGLTGQEGTVSFQSSAEPSKYLRHFGAVMYLEDRSKNPRNPRIFSQDATFRIREDKFFQGWVAFESVNYPGRYIRHQGYTLKTHKDDGTPLMHNDASFKILYEKTRERCQDLIDEGIKQSGEYEFEKDGKKYKMYCEISDDMHHGYTFIPIDAIQEDCTELFGGALSIEDLQSDAKEVQLRMQTITTDEDGKEHRNQYSTLITQLGELAMRSNAGIKVSINGNGDGAYQGPVQKNMGSYIHVGVTAKEFIEKGAVQGFVSNGKEVEFTNTDGNKNAYWACFPNRKNKLGHPVAEDRNENSVAGQWRKSRLGADEAKYVPNNYFMDCEMHFGGGGTFQWTNNFATHTKLAVGIPFEIVPEVEAKSCQEVYLAGHKRSGKYNLLVDGEKYEVTCQFHGYHGYMFFPKSAITTDSNKFYGKFSPSEVQTDKSKVLLQMIEATGQKQVLLQQLEKFSQVPIGLDINGNLGEKYKGVTTPANDAYMFAGFIPKSAAASKTEQGMRMNGKPEPFNNCDANPNSYIALRKDPNPSGRTNTDKEDENEKSMAVRLRNSFQPVAPEYFLSQDYFINLELHQGGCGAFEWSPKWEQQARFSMGIPFRITPTIEGAKSCAEVFAAGGKESGTYNLQDEQGNLHEVFCQAEGEDHGYSFIPPEALTPDSDKLYGQYDLAEMGNDPKKITVRLLVENEQFETEIKNLPKFADHPIKCFINGNGGYNKGPVNTMKPFIHCGLAPATVLAKKQDPQGFVVSGEEISFTNCDGNPNAYIAFFPNPEHSAGTGYDKAGKDAATSFLGKWFEAKAPVEKHEYIPDRYFVDCELHFGGCGGFEWTKSWATRVRCALGVGYKPDPEPVEEATPKPVTAAPEPAPAPDPNEPEPEPAVQPEVETTPDAPETTVAAATTKIPKDEMKDPECTVRRQKFVNKYKDLTGITDVSKVKFEESKKKKSKCFYQEKQCNDKYCTCVRRKSGKPRYRKKDKSSIQIPLDETDYQCDFAPKGCLLKRFEAKLDKDAKWIPECRENPKQYQPLQCEITGKQLCFCVKKRGKPRKKIAMGPKNEVTCP